MSTLLVNSKMNPALAARIEASVTGRRRLGLRTRSVVRLVTVLRLGLIVVVVSIAGTGFYSRYRERVDLQRMRGELLARWRAEISTVTESDRAFLGRLEGLLAKEAGDYPGDSSASELRGAVGLSTLLSRPSLYLRGPIAGYSSSATVAKLAMESGRDALLLCLLDPPTSPTEKLLMPKVRLALAGGSSAQQASANARRFADVIVGSPYLLPQWGERVSEAKDQATILRLEREFSKTSLSATKSALRAELIIAVYDEPNVTGGVTELDGEHVHAVRVVMLEPGSGKVWLRFRKQVDPSWVTPNRRSQYSRELDSCKLALEIRDSFGQ